ncbi:MAG TPA: cupredoxin domain-containing protein [Coriobacteriia bacterium]
MASSSSKQRKRSAQSPAPKAAETGARARWVIVGALIVVALFGAYRVLSAAKQRSIVADPAVTASGQTTPQVQPVAGSVTGPEVVGAPQTVGGVQEISIDVTNVYNPNVIRLKAGVPAELTFSGGQGCTSAVHSQQLGFSEDLSSGPKTVKLKGLMPGTYGFSCGMDMVFGKVVVQ